MKADLPERLRVNSCRFATETEQEAAKRRIAVDLEAANEIESLRAGLAEMVDTFRPFTLKPMGAPNSAVRRGQEHQIDVHKRARALLIPELAT